MNETEIASKAREINCWIESAVTETAHTFVNFPDSFSDYNEEIAKAKKNGVVDVEGWLADELYNDEDMLSDFLGDRVYDASKGDAEIAIELLKKIKEHSHTALVNVCNKDIERWKARKWILILIRKLRNI